MTKVIISAASMAENMTGGRSCCYASLDMYLQRRYCPAEHPYVHITFKICSDSKNNVITYAKYSPDNCKEDVSSHVSLYVKWFAI